MTYRRYKQVSLIIDGVLIGITATAVLFVVLLAVGVVKP
jgi:hypothetical protein